MYKKVKKIFKKKDVLILPIQYLIQNDQFISICTLSNGIDIEIVIDTVEFKPSMKLCCECYELIDEEYRRMMCCELKYDFYGYHQEEYEFDGSIDIPLNYSLPIFSIMVEANRSVIIMLDDILFYKDSYAYLNFLGYGSSTDITTDDNTYTCNSQPASMLMTPTINSGLIYPNTYKIELTNSDNVKITYPGENRIISIRNAKIEEKQIHIKITYKYKNYIGFSNRSMILGIPFVLDKITNTYPLTKINDTTFIENFSYLA